MRVAPWLTGALVLSMAFHACTCRSCGVGPEESETLAARPAPTKRPGWDAGLRSKPKPEIHEELADVPPPPPTPVITLEPTVPEEAELPDDFPADVPLPDKDAKPIAVRKMPQNGKSVFFNSEKPSEQIFALYQDEMQRNGWKKEQEYSTQHQSFLQFAKDGKNMQMTITTDPKTGKRIVQIMYHDLEPLPFAEF